MQVMQPIDKQKMSPTLEQPNAVQLIHASTSRQLTYPRQRRVLNHLLHTKIGTTKTTMHTMVIPTFMIAQGEEQAGLQISIIKCHHSKMIYSSPGIRLLTLTDISSFQRVYFSRYFNVRYLLKNKRFVSLLFLLVFFLLCFLSLESFLVFGALGSSSPFSSLFRRTTSCFVTLLQSFDNKDARNFLMHNRGSIGSTTVAPMKKVMLFIAEVEKPHLRLSFVGPVFMGQSCTTKPSLSKKCCLTQILSPL